MPTHHPKFGSPEPCECQRVAIQAKRMAKLDQIDGLNEVERAYRFGTERSAEQERVAADLRRMVTDGHGMATLTGKFGTGKTYLLIAAVNLAKANGQPAHYTTMTDLLRYLRQAFNPQNTDLSFDQRWDLLTTAPVLAIDELDKANTTPWAMEQFSALVDIRWRALRTHVTLFGMNAEMSALPGDIQDRLGDGRAQVFQMRGSSIRPFLTPEPAP